MTSPKHWFSLSMLEVSNDASFASRCRSSHEKWRSSGILLQLQLQGIKLAEKHLGRNHENKLVCTA
jgi:hypothetical protein